MKDGQKRMHSYDVLPDINPEMCCKKDQGTDVNEHAGSSVPFRAKVSLLLLVFINLINYMDRLTIAGEIHPMPYFEIIFSSFISQISVVYEDETKPRVF